MQSKVHPTYKTKYHVANWPAYILAAAHLDHADLYPDTTTTKPRIVRVYDYKDQAGALLPTEGDMRSKQL